jgi:hypothetical protein
VDPKVAEEAFSKMVICDAIMANTDRHLNNFGLIRDVNSLEIVGIAPLWDNGNSLFCDVVEVPEDPWAFRSRPFYLDPHIQVGYANRLDWFDPTRLTAFAELVAQTLPAKTPLGRTRNELIANGVRERIKNLSTLVREGK